MKNHTYRLSAATLAAAMMIGAAGCASGAKAPETTAASTPEAPAESAAETSSESASDASGAAESTAAHKDGAIRLAGLKGPTSIGMVKLLDDAEAGKSLNSYEFLMAASADEITPKFLQGELDIIAAPINLGSVLYNKSEGKVQMAAVNTLGVTYIVESGDSKELKTWADLKGETIMATGKGSVPEYSLTYLLKENGLDPEKDVTIDWKSEPTEVVASMKENGKGIAMLPQPFVTVAKTQISDLKTVFNMTEEWDKLGTDSRLITAGLFVRKDFAENHAKELADFLSEYQASTEYANANPADASKLVEKYGIVKAPIAEKAIPECNIVTITGEDMKKAASGFLNVLSELNPKAVGGKVPADDFYYAAQ
ncbi:MAG: ABC transporter substrate-binding protein [[Clostridium] aminophilum]|uniref:ABC transporter substrate-binding protein n=1 Tax=[Clostridium] aminophilum TaxID=1526 RepID=UPI0026F27504|nr:ABC transporter substrate-binding protein [[Clostridium] aminophilum]MDD6196543.1 ABC transporter substrate-binding protein [[Clostridium] aminophilum]